MNELTCDEIRDLAPAYVLGALERDEEAAVTEHLRDCPDAHAEMRELGEVTAYLDATVPIVEPPPSLRGRILAAAAGDLAARQATGAPARPVSVPLPLPDRVSPIDRARARRRDWRAWTVGLAAALAIIALGAWNVTIQQQLGETRSYQQRLSAALAQAGLPGSQVAIIASTSAGGGPGGIAVLPATGDGTLVISGLAPTSAAQVYEAWSIVEGHPPTPVAGFRVGPDGVGYVDRMPRASGERVTIAITLEPAPNPTAPSSAPIAAGIASPPAGAG